MGKGSFKESVLKGSDVNKDQRCYTLQLISDMSEHSRRDAMHTMDHSGTCMHPSAGRHRWDNDSGQVLTEGVQKFRTIICSQSVPAHARLYCI